MPRNALDVGSNPTHAIHADMAERFNATVLKTVDGDIRKFKSFCPRQPQWLWRGKKLTASEVAFRCGMHTTKALVANGAPLPRDREMVAETSIRGSRGFRFISLAVVLAR